MPSKSAGILLYRLVQGKIQVLLVHPGGPFWAKKDLGAWSIPKGEFDEEEPFEAAVREFKEETGFGNDGEFLPLTALKQPSRKLVYGWALEGDCNPAELKSNCFKLEWPPKSGKIQEFPEVDKADWFDIEIGKKKIAKGQMEFLVELEAILRDSYGYTAEVSPDASVQQLRLID